jgi:hypothetical protein
MSRRVELSSLSRRELENLMLTEHGALTRVLEAVRSTTEPNWKVRREVERIVEETVDRRPFVVAYERGAQTEAERRLAARNSARWSRWRGVDG